MAARMTCGCGNIVKNAFVNSIRHRGILAVNREVSTASTPSSSQSESTPDVTKIIIPRKKKRDELSILKALASTVKKDYNAPHYKYIDDPFLIPAVSIEKRSFALAKAAGQRAAKYVVNKYPDSFTDNPAEPSIEAFMPPSGRLHPGDTEEGLRERIHHRDPTEAFQSYRCLKDKGVKVDESVLNELLDLLCMYNSSDPLASFTPDEQFFKRETGQDNTKQIRKTWNDHGAAEEIFSDMKEANQRAYCSLIRGRAKYYQVDKAYELFREMREKGMKPDVQTYSALLKVASTRSENPEKRWDHVRELLTNMAEDEIPPNLSTFNNVLYTLTRSNRNPDCPQWVMQTLNEMRRLEIEPCLATWFYVLQVFYVDRESQSPILYDIITELEGKELTLQDENDLDFFSAAMVKCFFCVKDMELGYRIDALLNHANNIQFAGDGYREGVYYTHFMRLLCMFEDMDTIMDQYERITPHAYTPSFSALDDLLRAVEVNDGYQYLPKIWSDFVLFEYVRRTDLVDPVLSLMARRKHDSQLQDIFVDVSQKVKQKWEEDVQNRNVLRPLELSAPMVTNLSMINLHAGNFDMAWEFFAIYRQNRHQMTGFISEDCLGKLAEHCLHSKDFDKMMEVLKTLADFAYASFDVLAERTKIELNLSPDECNVIDDLV